MIRRRDQIRLSLQKLGLRKKRACFSIISVALGISVIVVLNSLTPGIRSLALNASFLSAIDPGTILVHADESPYRHLSRLREHAAPARRMQFITTNAIAEWRTWPGVEAAAPQVAASPVGMDALTNQPCASSEIAGVPEPLLQRFAANPRLLADSSNAIPLVIGERYGRLRFDRQKGAFEPADAAYAAAWIGREVVLRLGDPLAGESHFRRDDEAKVWKPADPAERTFLRSNFFQARRASAHPEFFGRQLALRGRIIGFCPGGRILAPEETVTLCSQWIAQREALCAARPADDQRSGEVEFSARGRRRTRPGEFQEAIVVVKPGADTAALAERLNRLGYETTTQESALKAFIEEFDSGIKYVRWIVYTIAGVILAIAAALLWSTTSRIVSDSRVDIGLFRAVGASRSDIRRLFLGETVLLGWLGTLAGMLIGWIVAGAISHWALQRMIQEMYDPDEYMHLPDTLLSVDPVFTVLLFAGAGTIAWMAGFLPARWASRIDPVKALRKE